MQLDRVRHNADVLPDSYDHCPLKLNWSPHMSDTNQAPKATHENQVSCDTPSLIR